MIVLSIPLRTSTTPFSFVMESANFGAQLASSTGASAKSLICTGSGALVRFFFLSSRRRHTRCSRAWSSDVCSSDLVEGLQKQGHEVERAQIRMPQGPLKQVGDYPMQIALHTDVAVTITVSVQG